jgi:hypothetical protein
VQEALLKAARAHPNITLVPDHGRHRPCHQPPRDPLFGAGHVWGVYAFNRATGRVELYTARATMLATGGAGRTYLFSTAPRGATGDGIAMAWRAGCRISNMEMMQFHPTCLYNLEVKNFLITEAVRGEGGHLLIPNTGHRFMPDYRSSAPNWRRAISWRARSTRRSSARPRLCPSRHQPDGRRIREGHFPNIYEKLLDLGIDMTKEPIPVVPAQHYTCGGIVIDRDGQDRPAQSLRGGRMQPVGAARRQSPRLQFAARMLRVRRGGGAPHHRQLGRSRPAAGDPALGREPRDRFRRGSRHQAELDRDPPLHVELCRHRPHDQAARARRAPHQACCATK